MTFKRKMLRKKPPKIPRCPYCHRKLTYHEGKDVWICESVECSYIKKGCLNEKHNE